MKNIYFAYPMTNGNKYINELNRLIDWLSKKKFNISHPGFLLFPELLVTETIKAIDKSDIVIADISSYSHGVGFEIGYAYAKNKKIILVANINERNTVSKFITSIFPEVLFYSDFHQLKSEISVILNL